MSVSVSPDPSGVTHHDRGYHSLRIRQVVRETDDASSFVLDVPPELAATYRYDAGQFLTFRATIDGHTLYRSYSMSSAPAVGDLLAVTVKRVPGGAVSNWMNDTLHEGDVVEASAPAGVFRLGPTERDLLAFAAGSGITPIFSILKTALSSTTRATRLLYANRDSESVIFAAALDDLCSTYGERLGTAHHLDVEHGFATAADIEPYVEAARNADSYICGPAPFMDLVESVLLAGGVPAEQIHIERFTVTEPVEVVEEPATAAGAAPDTTTQVTIELDGQTKTATHHPGTTILQTARQMGMSPPYSCESGSCATCMAKLLEGEVKMHVNDALYEDEVADGWILTCQSVPTTPTVHVVYGYEGN
jgi:3-ketosteroid 9alpha-monooxygenase subunit B